MEMGSVKRQKKEAFPVCPWRCLSICHMSTSLHLLTGAHYVPTVLGAQLCGRQALDKLPHM